jgi:hypothetical protein
VEGHRDLADVVAEAVTEPGEPLDVATATEPRPGAGEQHRPDRRIVGERGRRVEQLLCHPQVDAVRGVGPVQGEPGDTAVALDDQGLVRHGSSRTTLTDALIRW